MNSSRYEQVEDGQWWLFHEGRSDRRCKIACCDCGLVHRFRIKLKAGRIYMQANRLPSETGGFRAAMKRQEAMKPEADLRSQALRALRRHGPMTADECAARIGATPFNLRPRFSELRAAGRIDATGIKRNNDSGRAAHVWGLVKP
jgi:hypothetical protein